MIEIGLGFYYDLLRILLGFDYDLSPNILID